MLDAITRFIAHAAVVLLAALLALALAYGCLWALDGIAGIVAGWGGAA